MCGIVGISAETNVAAEIYDSLLMLQHRGQDAAGMVVCDQNDKLSSRKSMGYVRDVFQQRHMEQLLGNYGIGHIRYPTAGGAGKEFAQPMYVNSPYGISFAHNGNLTNSKQLSNELFHAEMRHLQTDSDSEVLLNIFAHELGKQREIYPSPKNIFKAVRKTHLRCDGAYAVLGLVTGHGIVAFRDNNGIRPLSIGVRKGNSRDEYIIASEDALFKPLGFNKLRDIEPGEAVFIDKSGQLHSEQCSESPKKRPCIFEYVYFSRPDSKIDEISVYKARMRMGSKLAAQIKNVRPDHNIDVVIDRLIIDNDIKSRLADSFELATSLTDGLAVIEIQNDKKNTEAERILFSANYACPVSGFTIEEIEPRLFSFNNPKGACNRCDGLGTQYFIDEELVIPDKNLSINDGAIAP